MRRTILCFGFTVVVFLGFSGCASRSEQWDFRQSDVDLDGDGKMDEIGFLLDDTASNFTLSVNGDRMTSHGENVESSFGILDIDTHDSYKEIAVSEWGPSSDYFTSFYYYDGHDVVFMGKTAGLHYDLEGIKGIQFNGDGTFVTQTRASGCLQTWFYSDQYVLDLAHLVLNVSQDLYEMNSRVTVLGSIPLQSSRTGPEVVTNLEVGEVVTILSSDETGWYLVENSKGTRGWFEIKLDSCKISGTDLSSGEVFEGLSFAD